MPQNIGPGSYYDPDLRALDKREAEGRKAENQRLIDGAARGKATRAVKKKGQSVGRAKKRKARR